MDSKAKQRLGDDTSSSSDISDFYKDFRPRKKPAPRRQDPGRRSHRGHIYDSETGITCHFCRQKTVDKHVVCRKCASAFCGHCLWKRHGEDVVIEAVDDCWVCPKCRGGCGPGCQNCCNCSICRQKQNLKPPKVTRLQMQARGFNNVHDYLIFLETKESPEKIRARKIGKRWCVSCDKSTSTPGQEKFQANCSKDPKKSHAMRNRAKKSGIIFQASSSEDEGSDTNDSSDAKESHAASQGSSSEDEVSESTISPLKSREGMGRKEVEGSKGTPSRLRAEGPSTIHTCEASSEMTHTCEGSSGMIHTCEASSSNPTRAVNTSNEAQTKRPRNDVVPLLFRSREEFTKKLEARLAEPYDEDEFKSLWDDVRRRKPVCDSIEGRGGEETEFSMSRPGQSLVDLHPDLARKLTSTREREEKLKLLRGFFMWLEHTCTEGAFKPWMENKEDEECLALDGPDCQVLGAVVTVDDDEDDRRTSDPAGDDLQKQELTKRQVVDPSSHKKLVFNWDEEDIKPKLNEASSVVFDWDLEDAKPKPKEPLAKASSLANV